MLVVTWILHINHGFLSRALSNGVSKFHLNHWFPDNFLLEIMIWLVLFTWSLPSFGFKGLVLVLFLEFLFSAKAFFASKIGNLKIHRGKIIKVKNCIITAFLSVYAFIYVTGKWFYSHTKKVLYDKEVLYVTCVWFFYISNCKFEAG